MGWDIVTVGKHNLDTSSLEALAKDLSDRLNINVIAEYSLDYEYCEDTNTITMVGWDEKVEVCRIIKSSKLCTFVLKYMNSYSAYLLAQRFGQKINSVVFEDDDVREYFFEDVADFDQYYFDLFSQSKKNKEMDLSSAFIYKQSISLNFNYPIRWFGFIDLFKESNWDTTNTVLPMIRRCHKNYYSIMGSESIYVFPDQGCAQMIMDYFFNSWEELEGYIASKRYVKDCAKVEEKTYCESDKWKYIHFSVSDFFRNNHPLYKQCDDLTVMYDDFSDIDD